MAIALSVKRALVGTGIVSIVAVVLLLVIPEGKRARLGYWGKSKYFSWRCESVVKRFKQENRIDDEDVVPPIVCLGDSITAGEGVPLESTFPAVLSGELGVEAINAGVAGNVTLDGLKRLPGILLAQRPGLLILQFGANHLNRGSTPSQAAANLVAMRDCVHFIYPETPVLVVAPSAVLSVEEMQNTSGMWFVSIDDVLRRHIDPGTRHPSAEGHAEISAVLVDTLHQAGLWGAHQRPGRKVGSQGPK